MHGVVGLPARPSDRQGPRREEGIGAVAEIFRRAGGAFRERREGHIDAGRLKVTADIEAFRTAVPSR